MSIKDELIPWLKNNNLYDDFEQEIRHHHRKEVEEYVQDLPKGMFPSEYISYGIKDSPVTNKPSYWESAQWRWRTRVNMKESNA